MNKLRKFLAVLVIGIAGFEGFGAGFNTGSVPLQKKKSQNDTGSVPLREPGSSEPININSFGRLQLIVTPGSPTIKPVKLSFGFVSVEDDRFLACYSKTGQNLWLTHIGKIRSISTNESDFIFVVTKSGELVLVNPSGTVLWRNYLDFIPENPPLPTSEGRIYVSSATNLACIGIGGILKWSVQIEKQGELTPVLLNDQSLLVFLKREKESKSCAVRYSMYGEILEEIVFQGNVINRFSVPDGLVLVFSDGSIGKMNVNKDFQTVSAWKNNDFYSNKNTIPLLLNSTEMALVTPDRKLDIIDFTTGKVKTTFKMKEITGMVSSVDFIDSMFVIIDDRFCAVYSESGQLLNSYLLPEKTEKFSWRYVLFLDNGLIEFLCDDWTISVFKILSTSKENESVSSYDVLTPVKQFFDSNSFDFSSGIYKKDYSKLMDEIKFGNYGSKEIELTNICLSAINCQLEKNNTYERNLTNEIERGDKLSLSDYENIFKLTTFLQNSTLQKTIIGIIDTETDSIILSNALEALAACPYDADGKILESLQALIRRTNPKDKQVLVNAANLAYEISHFMGKPAFSSKGKLILGELFGPQYDFKIKQFVRSLYQKLADNK